MNKVMVVKNFALRGFNDVRQNPQKYIFKLKKAKSVAMQQQTKRKCMLIHTKKR